jgi:hypothetical protein
MFILPSIVSNVCFISCVLEWTIRAIGLSNNLRASHGGILEEANILQAVVCFLLLSCASMALAASDIPKAAWSRPIGPPLENPGVTKDPALIDDGYWQGAPRRRNGGRHLLPLLSRRLLYSGVYGTPDLL